MSDQFFSWASRQDISARNRHILYKYVNKFKITSKENDCGKSLQQMDEHGGDKSTDTLQENCSGTVEETDETSVNIDEGKTRAKKMRKHEKQKNVVEGVVDTSSVVEKDKKKKRSMRKENSDQDCTEVDNDNKVSIEESVAIGEDSATKGRHGKSFVNECAEENRTVKKLKAKKRKVESKTGGGEHILALNGDVESIKKQKLDKLDQNKRNEVVQVGDTLDKHGTKKEKRKLKNRSLVVQDSNDKLPVETKSDVTGESSTVADASRNEELRIMDNTSDSLDGSYLSTLPKQAPYVNALETTTEIVKKDKSPVHGANNISILTFDSDSVTNVSEEENAKVSDKDVNLTPDSMPLAMFVRHSHKKAIT